MMVSASMSEPDVGTAMTELKTRGVIQGDRPVINGVIRRCSGAGHAQGCVLYCRLADKPGAAGVGAVYLEIPAGGVKD